MFYQLNSWALRLRRDVLALYLAASDPRVPWYAKALAALVAAYALSPIDLIPDFIPVIGYLDDLLILPLGIWLVVRMIPEDLMKELRSKAEALHAERPKSTLAALVIILIWLFVAFIILKVWLAP